MTVLSRTAVDTAAFIRGGRRLLLAEHLAPGGVFRLTPIGESWPKDMAASLKIPVMTGEGHMQHFRWAVAPALTHFWLAAELTVKSLGWERMVSTGRDPRAGQTGRGSTISQRATKRCIDNQLAMRKWPSRYAV
jgi:hypothetical protein